eukprot:CAMPEP_0115466786 /NCGR_PEP_ID=MMETSP0271-20121206/50101_1 /TAXON_ID=71861 /ORGANISM="Scrippsiella trochoidea, Strain CCMP3099" /LENGTH=79 /DNA_ID=CAMNT_0002893779 /DNA_START=56 /DNA_END=291 /DNA_ORIENTATION=-
MAADAAEQRVLPSLRGGSTLQECCLVLEDLQGLLEACKLSLKAGFALLVGLGLRDALFLNLLQVFKHSVKLGLHTRSIG